MPTQVAKYKTMENKTRQNFIVIFGVMIIITILLVRYIDSKVYKLETDIYIEVIEIYKSISRNTDLINLK